MGWGVGSTFLTALQKLQELVVPNHLWWAAFPHAPNLSSQLQIQLQAWWKLSWLSWNS